MHESWARRIRRAEELAADGGGAAPLLAFYARLLRAQSEIYEQCQSIAAAAAHAAPLLRAVIESAPEELAAEATALLESDGAALEERLLAYWNDRSDRDFFAKALLQPYAQRTVDDAGIADESADAAVRRCPRCGGAPQLAIANDAGRQLLCATCLTAWPFPRVVCAYCGEDDEKKLGYFQSPGLEHVRVDACESCQHYLKSIDLGRLGLAVPLVDEIAAGPLDLWAREHGYEKIELNLLGL